MAGEGGGRGVYYGRDAIEAVKRAARTVDVVSSRIPVKAKGRDYVKCKCPFHDDRKGSLTVYESGKWKCWNPDCRASEERMGRQGDVLTFTMMYDDVSFNEALESLADRYGVRLEDYREERPQRARGKGAHAAERSEARSEKAEAARDGGKGAKARRADRGYDLEMTEEELLLASFEDDDLDWMAEEAERFAMAADGVEEGAPQRGKGERAAARAEARAERRARAGRRSAVDHARGRRRADAMSEEEVWKAVDAKRDEALRTIDAIAERKKKPAEGGKSALRKDKGLKTVQLTREQALERGISEEQFDRIEAARRAQGTADGKEAPDRRAAKSGRSGGKPPERTFTRNERRQYARQKAREEARDARLAALKERQAAAAPRAKEMAEAVLSDPALGRDRRTLFVGILGGPGAGKQAAASELAASLRDLGWSAAVAPSVPDMFLHRGWADYLTAGSVDRERTVHAQALANAQALDGHFDVVVQPNPPVSVLAHVAERGERAEEFARQVYEGHARQNNFTFYLKREPGAPYDEADHLEPAGAVEAADRNVYDWMYEAAPEGVRAANYDRAAVSDGMVARQVERVYARAYGVPALDLKPRDFARSEVLREVSARPAAREFAAAAFDAGWKPSEARELAVALSDERLGMLAEGVRNGMACAEARELAGPELDGAKAERPQGRRGQTPPGRAEKARADSPGREREAAKAARPARTAAAPGHGALGTRR